jgi:hypothetical protein
LGERFGFSGHPYLLAISSSEFCFGVSARSVSVSARSVQFSDDLPGVTDVPCVRSKRAAIGPRVNLPADAIFEREQ